MGALARRGLVVSRQGVGSFVSEANRMTNSLTEALDFHEVIDRGGSAPGVIFDSAVTEACPASIAELLSLPPGSKAHRSHKRFTADGETVIYATTTIPISVLTPRSAADIETDPERSEPLFTFMAAQGLDTAYQLSSLAARVGRDVPYPDHDLDPDAAIIELAEVGYTDTNQAIWHSRNWYTPDAMAFDLVRRRPPDLPNQA